MNKFGKFGPRPGISRFGSLCFIFLLCRYCCRLINWCVLEDCNEFVVEDEDKGTADTPQNVGEIALEVGLHAFILKLNRTR